LSELIFLVWRDRRRHDALVPALKARMCLGGAAFSGVVPTGFVAAPYINAVAINAVAASPPKLLHLAAGAAALPGLPRIARVQGYPTRPVRIIVGFPPGGQIDVNALADHGGMALGGSPADLGELLADSTRGGNRRESCTYGSGAARLAAIPAGESPADRGVQSLL
jgi:hypothetical protein